MRELKSVLWYYSTFASSWSSAIRRSIDMGFPRLIADFAAPPKHKRMPCYAAAAETISKPSRTMAAGYLSSPMSNIGHTSLLIRPRHPAVAFALAPCFRPEMPWRNEWKVRADTLALEEGVS